MFITNTGLVNTRHARMAFTGAWKESFGCPSPAGSWIIWGASGSGKTSLALQLAGYLTQHARVLYWSIEQGNTESFRNAWLRAGLQECGGDIMLANEGEDWESIIARISRKRGREVLIIDSLTPLRAQAFGIKKYESIRRRLGKKLLIWISHEKAGLPDTQAGDYIMKLADLKMRVEGFKAFTNARSGKALADFVVWEEGCNDYWMNR